MQQKPFFNVLLCSASQPISFNFAIPPVLNELAPFAFAAQSSADIGRSLRMLWPVTCFVSYPAVDSRGVHRD